MDEETGGPGPNARHAKVRTRKKRTMLWVDPFFARTGYQWTRKVGRKTVTVALSAEQFKAMKKAVQNGRRLRKTLRAMEVLSRQILFATTPDTRRSKPFATRDLRLI